MPEKRVKILWIPILTKDLQQDLGEWLCTSPQGGEEAVRSYIIRHPEKIELGLEFLSAELYLGPRLRADLLFRKEKKYYIVETKYGRWSEKRVREKVLRYRDALIETLKKKKVDFKEVIPVVVASVEVHPFRRRYAIWYRKKIRLLKPTKAKPTRT